MHYNESWWYTQEQSFRKILRLIFTLPFYCFIWFNVFTYLEREEKKVSCTKVRAKIYKYGSNVFISTVSHHQFNCSISQERKLISKEKMKSAPIEVVGDNFLFIIASWAKSICGENTLWQLINSQHLPESTNHRPNYLERSFFMAGFLGFSGRKNYKF